MNQSPETLSIEEKQELLKIARTSIQKKLEGIDWIPESSSTPRLARVQGAFVTLHKNGRLRGCIGYIEGVEPLFQTVAHMARAAAFADPRFPSLRPGELAEIDIEITVLSPLRRITDPQEVEVGKHGLVISRGYNKGVLLPQVPVEQEWDRETFLSHTCMKAGLHPDCWKQPDTEIQVFSGQVFGEK